MAHNFNFVSQKPIFIDNIYELEASVEDICDRYNVFHNYFGNILLAASEMFHLIKKMEPIGPIQMYSTNKMGILSIGFFVDTQFLDIGGLIQKEMQALLNYEHLNFSEQCAVKVVMFSDRIQLLEKNGTIELSFFLNCVNADVSRMRTKLIETYFSTIKDKLTEKRNV